jgi:hypothetical protein
MATENFLRIVSECPRIYCSAVIFRSSRTSHAQKSSICAECCGHKPASQGKHKVFHFIRSKGEKRVISGVAAFLTLLGGLTSPAMSQIITPTLIPPPCSSHCVNPVQGAKIIPQGATQAARGCPSGTVFNARKGTCKVLQPVPGMP